MVVKKKPKIVAIIQARVSSRRLPRKVLLPLQGKTVLEWVFQRVAKSQLVNEVVIATTTDLKDDVLVLLCRKKRMPVFRGSRDDVLDRYYQAAKKYRADYIVRITADCPLIDPAVIDKLIKKHFDEENDHTGNAYVETYPDGLDAEIFTFQALKDAWQNAVLGSEREHPTQYITKNPQKFKLGNLAYKENLADKRWTLDEPEDYQFLKQVFKGLQDKLDEFRMQDVLELLQLEPELEKINRHISRNEGLARSLKKDRLIRSKRK